VQVHGHGQCTDCGSNVDPCCAGASAADDASSGGLGSAVAVPDPGLFARLFVRLGGAAATVTTESLLFALATAQDCDRDEARLLLEAGERIGLVVRIGDDCHRLRRSPP
jgi:hypothetical protein